MVQMKPRVAMVMTMMMIIVVVLPSNAGDDDGDNVTLLHYIKESST